MDLLQVAGKYPPPPGDSGILGVEGAVQLAIEVKVWCTNPY